MYEATKQHYLSRPKKTIATGVLLLNSADEILMVKPNYKEGWLLPGGSVEENESPRAAGIREVKEEIGLDIEKPRLVSIDYIANTEGVGDALRFIFFGGALSSEQVTNIVLQKEELDEYRFFPLSEVHTVLSPRLVSRMEKSIEAIKGGAVYLELGI
jgi:8-oxo-dGTP pyrophosphatase MutT (NUDIX family)